ncbi:MAG: hypothetical protein EAZ53_04135 [Bacteroidetes bacterium]|nr:MAG: hypothetical protein EAZ53_04135 [Bacteroidota bacterium]
MKLTSYLTASTIALFLVFGGCGKDEEVYYTIFTIYDPIPESAKCNKSPSPKLVCGKTTEGANIKIYNSKDDYLSDKNLVATFTTDNKGEYKYTHEKGKVFWFRVLKDSLTSYFSGTISNNLPQSYSDEIENRNIDYSSVYSESFKDKGITLMLSEVPLKMQIKVFKSGVAQVGKEVKLFKSESDKLNNKPYQNIYTSIYYYPIITNSQGVATFTNLYPYNYTIDVEGVEPTPKYTGKLKPNPDVNNYLEISIP